MSKFFLFIFLLVVNSNVYSANKEIEIIHQELLTQYKLLSRVSSQALSVGIAKLNESKACQNQCNSAKDDCCKQADKLYKEALSFLSLNETSVSKAKNIANGIDAFCSKEITNADYAVYCFDYKNSMPISFANIDLKKQKCESDIENTQGCVQFLNQKSTQSKSEDISSYIKFNNGVFTDVNGKKWSAKDFSDYKSMLAAGIKPKEARILNRAISRMNEATSIEQKKILAILYSHKSEYGSGGVASNEYVNLKSLIDKTDGSFQSTKGVQSSVVNQPIDELTRRYNGESIAVSMADLFQLIKKRYNEIDKKGQFLDK